MHYKAKKTELKYIRRTHHAVLNVVDLGVLAYEHDISLEFVERVVLAVFDALTDSVEVHRFLDHLVVVRQLFARGQLLEGLTQQPVVTGNRKRQ